MKTKLLLLALAISLFSCSPNIVNKWNIDKYQIVNNAGQNTSAQNIGSIEFMKNGQGKKSIKYNVFQNNFTDETPFTYDLNKEYIVIKGNAQKSESKKQVEESDFNKTWIIVSDKKKKQVWKSTDGSNSVQILELSR